MYGGNYLGASYAKSADFLRYLRTGQYDPALKSTVVYTPQQVMAELECVQLLLEVDNFMLEVVVVDGTTQALQV